MLSDSTLYLSLMKDMARLIGIKKDCKKNGNKINNGYITMKEYIEYPYLRQRIIPGNKIPMNWYKKISSYR